MLACAYRVDRAAGLISKFTNERSQICFWDINAKILCKHRFFFFLLILSNICCCVKHLNKYSYEKKLRNFAFQTKYLLLSHAANSHIRFHFHVPLMKQV